MKQKYELKAEYTQQGSAILAGLIGIGVVIVQALISIGATDLPALISVLAFAIALPLLGALIILNVVQARYRYASYPAYLALAYTVAEGSAVVGVVAAFWHVSWMAGVLLLVSGVTSLTIAFAYSKQLQKDNAPDQNEKGE